VGNGQCIVVKTVQQHILTALLRGIETILRVSHDQPEPWTPHYHQ